MSHLADGFDEGLALDITDGAANLSDDHIGLGLVADVVDKALDFICNVGDGLHSGSKVLATALLGDDIGIDLACGQVGVLIQVFINKPLIVSQVKVGFCAVLSHIDFAVLIGTHGSGVNIDVWVQFLRGHLQPSRFQQTPQRCCCDTFTQTGHNAARHENILCHIPSSREKLTKKEEDVHQGIRIP